MSEPKFIVETIASFHRPPHMEFEFIDHDAINWGRDIVPYLIYNRLLCCFANCPCYHTQEIAIVVASHDHLTHFQNSPKS